MADENGTPLHMLSSEGRIVYKSNGNTWFTETQVKDHLGSVRAVCSRNSTNGSRITRQVDSYYPFGMNIKELSQTSDAFSANEYMYNGKMYQDEMGLGLLDYGARFYDAVLGRWHVVDPLLQYVSGYAYCGNDPINMVDPTGKWATQHVIATTYVDKDYNVLLHIPDEDNYVYMVNNPIEWWKNGMKKEGLSKVGWEDPKRTYNRGEHYDFYMPPSVRYLLEGYSMFKTWVDFWNDFLGGPEGEDVELTDKMSYMSLLLVISKFELPTKGQYQYKPPKGWKNSKRLPTGPLGGFIDELGSIWTKARGSNIQGEIHFDVQLSKKAQQRYNTTKSHLNINKNGEIAH